MEEYPINTFSEETQKEIRASFEKEKEQAIQTGRGQMLEELLDSEDLVPNSLIKAKCEQAVEKYKAEFIVWLQSVKAFDDQNITEFLKDLIINKIRKTK